MNLTLSSKDCKCDGVVNTSRTRKIWGWRCSTTVQPRKRLPLYFQVNVEYALRPGATFASKVLHIRSSVPFSKCNGGIYTVTLVEPFGPSFSLSAGHDHDVHTSGHLQLNPFAQGLQVAQFVRWPPLSRGSFVSIANPYSRFSFDTSLGLLKASYTPLITHRASKLDGTAHSTDPAVIGLVNLTSYSYTTGGINLGERRAFVQCVDALALDAASRPDGRSVKVNVAWDESDYQIDWATDAGHAEYKRIIDRNAELGVTHVVAAPRNTLLADRRNATDSWGWEASLWFGLGALGLSSIGTAGLNHVLCMIPARDASEFALFPEADKAIARFVTGSNGPTYTTRPCRARCPFRVSSTRPSRPQIGAVDGTVAMGEGDELGFLFLFNPGMVPLNASLRVDESLGIAKCLGGCGVDRYRAPPAPSHDG